MVIRQNVSNLRPEQLSKLREAHKLIMARIDNRSYRHIAGIHGWLEEWCEHEPKPDPGGSGRKYHLFLPWHRAYCYTLEKNLQIVSQDNTLALPYWNWRSPRAEGGEPIPTAYSEPTVGGQPNPLHHFRMIINGRSTSGEVVNVNKDTQRDVGTWPRARSLRQIRERTSLQGQDIPQVLNEESFLEFSEKLRQGWHNLIHMYVGGNRGEFSNPDVAAYDPIFWPHHIQIDRIWRMWQRDHGAENMPEYMKDVPLAPFGRLKVKDVLNVSNLEYDYARVAGET
jgi:tyrosinase